MMYVLASDGNPRCYVRPDGSLSISVGNARKFATIAEAEMFAESTARPGVELTPAEVDPAAMAKAEADAAIAWEMDPTRW